MFRFLFIRVLCCVAVILLVSIFWRGPDLYFMAGVMAGSLLSVYKAALYGIIPVLLAQNARGKQIRALLFGIFSQIITIVLLLAAVKINVRLFFGVSTGLIAMVIVVCVNAFTEKWGVTHNQWGEKHNK